MQDAHPRRASLAWLSHDQAVVAEVLEYCTSPFTADALTQIPAFPLPTEPHVADWIRYASEAGDDAFAYLQQRLPQLNIPIRAGVSATEEYSAVVFEGQPFDEASFQGRLTLERPDLLRVRLHEHEAGALPVLWTSHRPDFAALWRAFVGRSEPKPLGATVNAQMVSGFINWDRVHRYREAWAAGLTPEAAAEQWPAKLGEVAESDPGAFYDRFILICTAPYSGVSAAELGLPLDEDTWVTRSTTLRVEHEFTHYTTKRLYGVMRLNLHDELLADCMGMTSALGEFRAAWFLRCFGLESWPSVRADGRVHVYRGTLSDEAFTLVCALAYHAAQALERACTQWYRAEDRGRFVIALSWVTPDILAGPEGDQAFAEAFERAAAYVRGAEAA